MHKTGRPVLVGTTSVEQSDLLSEQLCEAAIPHEVLNAKPENVEREAEIVAQRGRLGAVTIATNMAGHGTDIILGGNAEFMVRLKLREILMPRVVKLTDGEFVSVKKARPQKSWKVNESLFPCNLSKEKVAFAEEAVDLAVKTWGQRSLTELEAEERLSLVSRIISFVFLAETGFRPTNRIQNVDESTREAQRKVENYFFDTRKQLFEYDEVLNSQRDRVYTERRRALESDSLQSLLIEYAELTMDDILEANIGSETPKESWDLEKLVAKIQQYCYLLNDLTPELLKNKSSNYEELRDYLHYRGREAYLQKRDIVEKQAPGLMKEAERFLILSNIDRLWKEHLQAIKFVQQAVGLRGYAQQDPLIEYKLEGFNLFLEMMAQIRRNVIYSIYQFQPVLVKDKKQEENGKLASNGKGSDNKPNPVGVAGDSISLVYPSEVLQKPMQQLKLYNISKELSDICGCCTIFQSF